MLQFILLQNRQGKTRLSKYYRPYTDEERLKIETEVHRIVTTRDAKFTNFVEFRSYKLIYRRYAGLFFTLAVDVHDNELLYFESIHLFVELLDQFFGNVCELDLVFNFNKVRAPRPPARRRRPRRDERRWRPPRTSDPRARVPSAPPRCILAAPFPQPLRVPRLQLSRKWCVCRAARRTPQVYMILDEFFLAGEVQETSKQAILHRVQELDKLE